MKVVTQGSWPVQLCSCIFSCGCLAGVITFLVYLGIYAFNNPEPQAYYIAETPLTQAYLVDTVADVEAEGVTPIHDQFVTWFTWVFANALVPMSFSCIMPVIMCIMARSPCLGGFCGMLVGCSWCVSMIVVYVFGLIWRYSAAGQYASGDLLEEDAVAGPLMQVSSGKFISIYYLISYI